MKYLLRFLTNSTRYLLATVISLCLSFALITTGYAAAKTHEYQLKNGLKILVKEDHRAPVVMSQVWYKVGSSYEPSGITGIAHVLEHMMFKGTKRYPEGKLNKIVAELGGVQNAGTSADYTVYFQKLPAKDLKISFDLEADRMQNLIVTEKAFAKEIKVVREERRMRTDNIPKNKTYERFQAAAHISSPYHHPVIGWMRDLNNMNIKDVKNWYKTWYAPNNAILVVVGDVNPQQVLRLAKKYFGPLKPSKLPKMKPQQDVKPISERRLTVHLPAQLPWIIFGYSTPTLATDSKSWKPYALEVLQAVLDGGDSARLQKDLVRGKQIASYIDTNYSFNSRLPGLFSFDAIPTKGHSVEDVRNAIQMEVSRLKHMLVSNKELERIKAQVIAQKIYAQDSIYYQASLLGGFEVVGLSWKEIDNYVKRIQAVTPEQIRKVAQEYFIPERLTIAVLKPLPMNVKPS